jgi:multidrug efflux pump
MFLVCRMVSSSGGTCAREFSTQELAGLGIDRAALIAALQAQNSVSPSGSLQTGNEKLLIRTSGAFRSENDLM